MKLLLTAISGICWTLVYIDLIRRGFKDKTCGMPLFALGLNIAWEVLYSIDGLFIHHAFIPAQSAANVAWAVCDCLILVTWFKFGKALLPEKAQQYFVPYSILAIASCAVMQLAFYIHFFDNVVAASQYSAFAQNATMSILFLSMLFRRENTKGQSMLIAVGKCIGTLAPTILGGFVESINWFIICTGAVSFIFDVIYIVFFANAHKEEQGVRL
ncbi:MAG: hypothetical protein ACOYB8_08235 [Eubacteriaceae bacterium]|jgi:hypothetical protein